MAAAPPIIPAGQIPVQTQEQQPGIQREMTPRPVVISDTYKGADKLKDKVAIVTGGDSGIGRSVAVHFAREGADVCIVYLPSEQADAAEAKKMIEAEGRRCKTFAGDLRDRDVCRRVVEETVAELGRLDILVNNAAIQYWTADVREVTAESMQDVFDTNIKAYIYLVQAALDRMTPGSCIINTTSVVAYKGHPNLMEYSCTKGAEVALTRSLAMQLVGKGIRVNGVAPGPIWTPLIPASFPADMIKEQWETSCPMNRPGQPAECAPAYVFLASEVDSSFFTGQVLHPNGGVIVNA